MNRKICGVRWSGKEAFGQRSPDHNGHTCARPPRHPGPHACKCSAKPEDRT